MKNILKLFILSTIMTLSSCEDFLDKTPLDEVSEVDFYRTPADLRAAVNAFYQDFPSWANTSVGFSVLPDSNSDMGIAESINSKMGEKESSHALLYKCPQPFIYNLNRYPFHQL